MFICGFFVGFFSAIISIVVLISALVIHRGITSYKYNKWKIKHS
jgi:hypothetical protein